MTTSETSSASSPPLTRTLLCLCLPASLADATARRSARTLRRGWGFRPAGAEGASRRPRFSRFPSLTAQGHHVQKRQAERVPIGCAWDERSRAFRWQSGSLCGVRVPQSLIPSERFRHQYQCAWDRGGRLNLSVNGTIDSKVLPCLWMPHF